MVWLTQVKTDFVWGLFDKFLIGSQTFLLLEPKWSRIIAFCFSSKAPDSSLSFPLEPWKWIVQYAPPPQDIYWENITAGHGHYVAKMLLVNILMFILLVILFIVTWSFVCQLLLRQFIQFRLFWSSFSSHRLLWSSLSLESSSIWRRSVMLSCCRKVSTTLFRLWCSGNYDADPWQPWLGASLG